jgi:D-glycero-alpha-D-manno-heptose 1-phosphate guanylyltransferase
MQEARPGPENTLTDRQTRVKVHGRIEAAILAGGFGTRLRPALADRPKVLAPVIGRPFITYLLDQLVDAGCTRTILLTGYKAEQVQHYLGDSYSGMILNYSRETEALGTGGALRLAMGLFTGVDLVVLNGDSYCSVDFRELLEFHHTHKADLTMTLAHVSDTSRFGQVQLDAQQNVRVFGEKNTIGSGWINAGVYVLKRALIRLIGAGVAVSFEREVIPDWMQRYRVLGFPCRGCFLDIGTPQSYALAHNVFASRPAAQLCLIP